MYESFINILDPDQRINAIDTDYYVCLY